MNRLASHLFLTALLSLPVVACGDDASTGSGTESETGTGTAGSSSGGPGNTETSNSGTSNGSADGGSGTTGPGESTGMDSTAGSETGEPGTTTGADTCDACIGANCGDELAACTGEPDCDCWLTCLAEGNDPPTCGMMCNGMPPMELFQLNNCIDAECDAECNGGGSTGGGAGGSYEPCMGDMDCDMGLVCNMFLGYCSINCMGDDMACPAPPQGDSQPICSNMSDTCLLPCGDGETCPDGMNCEMVGGGGGFQLCRF